MAAGQGILAWMLAFLIGSTFAADLATISALTRIPDAERASHMVLTVQGIGLGGDVESRKYSVFPLTVESGLNQTDSFLFRGQLVPTTSSNYASLSSSEVIAFLSCDQDSSSSSHINPNTTVNTLINNDPPFLAILLYSQRDVCCSLQGPESITAHSDQYFFTTAGGVDATDALSFVHNTTGVVEATISNDSSADYISPFPSGGTMSHATTVVLYVATGLAVAGFMSIFTFGAVRARRFPELYGPSAQRPGGGTAPQGHVRGLARAVLDTLPIVKFGDPAPTKADPDVELGEGGGGGGGNAARDHSPLPPDDAERGLGVVKAALGERQEAGRSGEEAKGRGNGASPDGRRECVDAARPAANATEIGSQEAGNSEVRGEDDRLVCSICTEPFVVGEDVRVLPCKHQFHPACVDPWLINESGTCPLCRYDLPRQLKSPAERPPAEWPPIIGLRGGL